MDIVLQNVIGEFIYRVAYDDNEDFDMDFDNEEDKQNYLNNFECGLLNSYVIYKYIKCPCCPSIGELVDCIGGVHAESASEALDYYLGI